MNDNVVQFPGVPLTGDGTLKTTVPSEFKFTVGEDEFYASCVARP